MDTWAQEVEAMLVAHLKAKKARKVEVQSEAVPHTWDDCQNGNHNWSCIGVGHGIETLECTCCQTVREFEV
jgi:hypothetical protein